MRLNPKSALMGCLLLLLATPLAAQWEEIVSAAPYVPSPQEIVEEMLRLAEVKESDLVIDLGSGDGRIPITAAKLFGARGRGVELDPNLIQESQDNARKAGVAEKVEFVQQNMLDANLSDATVLTLYVGSALNRQLRPKIIKELRPGTRVVSHNYDMEDWAPDKRLELDGRVLYLWIVRETKAADGK